MKRIYHDIHFFNYTAFISIIVVLLLLMINFSGIIKNEGTISVFDADTDSDGIPDDLEIGTSYNLTWTSPAGDEKSSRFVDTALPDDKNFMWALGGNINVTTNLVFYDSTVFFSTYDNSDESSTLCRATENVGYTDWQRTFSNAKIMYLMISETANNDDLILFYEDMDLEDGTTELRIMVLNLRNLGDTNDIAYWPTYPGGTSTDKLVLEDMNYYYNSYGDDYRMANQPVVSAGKLYFCSLTGVEYYLTCLDLATNEYMLDGDLWTVRTIKEEFGIHLDSYGSGAYSTFLMSWKIVINQNELFLAMNRVGIGTSTGGKLLRVDLTNPLQDIAQYPSADYVSPTCDMTFVNDKLVVLSKNYTLASFSNMPPNYLNYEFERDISNDIPGDLIPVGLPCIGNFPGIDEIIVFSITDEQFFSSTKTPWLYKYTGISHYSVTPNSFVSLNDAEIECPMGYNTNFIGLNKIVLTTNGTYTCNITDSTTQITQYNSTLVSTGPVYDLESDDTTGFILANGKLLIHNSRYINGADRLTVECYGGWSTDSASSDTDGDGLADGWNDTNTDGIYDSSETKGEIGYYNAASTVFEGGHRTEPARNDTDYDAVNDYVEVNGWVGYISQTVVYSDPLDSDTDDDRLIDGIERYLRLDPTLESTDTDELSDYSEVFGWWTVENENVNTTLSNDDTVFQNALYVFKAGDNSSTLKYEGTYRIKYTGTFKINSLGESFTAVNVTEKLEDELFVTDTFNGNDVTDSDNLSIDSTIGTVSQQTNNYTGSFYVMYTFDIENTTPQRTRDFTLNMSDTNSFYDTTHESSLKVNTVLLQRMGLMKEIVDYSVIDLDSNLSYTYPQADGDGNGDGDGPTDVDTDGDGLNDLVELLYSSCPMDNGGKDTDLDGITDKDEINNFSSITYNPVDIAFRIQAGNELTISGGVIKSIKEEDNYLQTRNGVVYESGEKYVVDGSINTNWTSALPPSDGHTPQLILDLGHHRYISKIQIYSSDPHGLHNVDEFTISYFTTHYENSQSNLTFSCVEKGNYYDITLTFSKIWTRYLVFNITSTTGGNAHIREIELYEPAFLSPTTNDTDGDGINDTIEINQDGVYTAGTDTNPLELDTDDDGLPDGWIDGWWYEPSSGWFVNESLIDGVKDSWEGEDLNTNGLFDGGETNAIDADTDDDGMPDGWEVINSLNPLDPGDANLPGTDNDNLTNLHEYLIGTDPSTADSDTDGLYDDEIVDVTFRTNIERGALTIENYMALNSTYWIMNDRNASTGLSNDGDIYSYLGSYRDIKIQERQRQADYYTMGLWHFDEESGTMANDSSESDNILSFDNNNAENKPSWESGIFSNCLSFDGNDYAKVDSDMAFDMDKTITLSAWIYPLATTNTRPIIYKQNSYELRLKSGKLSAEFYSPTGSSITINSSRTIEKYLWYHVAAVYNHSTISLYINGIKDIEDEWSKDINITVSKDIYVGTDVSNNSYEGKIDEIYISNIADLSLQDVVKTQALWHFDQDVNNLLDSSVNGNTGSPGSECAHEDSDPEIATGFINNAYTFDGVDDRITVVHNESLEFEDTMAAECWIKIDSSAAGDLPLIYKGNSFSWYLKDDSNEYYLAVITSYSSGGISNTTTVADTTELELDKWYHVGVVVDSTMGSNHVVKLYINGVKVKESAIGGPLNIDDSTNLYIGANVGGGSDFFNGTIDEVKLTDQRAISFLGNMRYTHNSIIGQLHDGSPIVFSNYDNNSFDRMYIWDYRADGLDRDSNGTLEGLCYEFINDTTLNVPAAAKLDVADVDYLHQELYIGNPLNPDTDGDGIWDGNEMSPTSDSDNDGFINMDDQDSDNDGLSDFLEDLDRDQILNETGEPDPLNSDSNDDGVNDGAKYQHITQYSWDRNADADWDTDNDGTTDFHDADSDGDGVNDSAEVNGDGVYNLTESDTNPVAADTDGDGLIDGANITVSSGDARYADWEEAGYFYYDEAGERTFVGEDDIGTDPVSWDTDGDGLNDGEEVKYFAYWFDTAEPDEAGDASHVVFDTEVSMWEEPPKKYCFRIQAKVTGANPALTLIADGEFRGAPNTTVISSDELINDGKYRWYTSQEFWAPRSFDYQGPPEFGAPFYIYLNTTSTNMEFNRILLFEPADGDGVERYRKTVTTLTNGSTPETEYFGDYNGTVTPHFTIPVKEDDVRFHAVEASITVDITSGTVFSFLNAGDRYSLSNPDWVSTGFPGSSQYQRLVNLTGPINRYIGNHFHEAEETSGIHYLDVPLTLYSNEDGTLTIGNISIVLEPRFTDPLNEDTDYDGVSDLEELSVLTNAMDRDTDGDGIDDGVELNDQHGGRKNIVSSNLSYFDAGQEYTLGNTTTVESGKEYYFKIPQRDTLAGRITNAADFTETPRGLMKWIEDESQHGEQIRDIDTADLDNDGWMDVLLVEDRDTTDRLVVYLNEKNGTFAMDANYDVGSNPQKIGLGDFDGNGYMDVAVTNYDDDDVSVYLNNGTALQSRTDYSVGDQPRGIEIADVTNDGYGDIIVANHKSTGDGGFTVYFNDGAGSFENAVTYDTSIVAYDVTVGDIDSDGWQDVIVLDNAGETVRTYENDNDGTFSFKAEYTLTATYKPEKALLDDLDHDGDLDLVISCSLSGTTDDKILTYLNDGSGAFSADIVYTTGENPTDMVLNDIDNDGENDLLVSCNALTGSNGKIHILYKTAAGVFTDNGTMVESRLSSLASTDVDNDGTQDIIAASYHSAHTKFHAFMNSTMSHVTRAYLKLKCMDGSSNGARHITVNIRNDSWYEFEMDVEGPGEDENGTYTIDLSHWLNAYLYSIDAIHENFTTEIGDYLYIPITIDVYGSGSGNVTVHEAQVEIGAIRTSPLYDDSDCDRISDRNEIYGDFTNPRDSDTDNDHIMDGLEDDDYTGTRESGETNCTDADSDEDGISDYDEVYGFGTDPLDADDDDDGIMDGTEVGCFVRRDSTNTTINAYNTPQDTDYLAGNMSDNGTANEYVWGDHDLADKPTMPKRDDSDEDGLLDGYYDTNTNGQYDTGEPGEDKSCNGRIDWYGEDEIADTADDESDPMQADMDGDGIKDARETFYGTDSEDADTDDDGLSDYEEIFVYKTDPTRNDTDNDKLPDGLEVGKTKGVWTANSAMVEKDANRYPIKNGNFENASGSPLYAEFWSQETGHSICNSISKAHTGFNSLKAAPTSWAETQQVNVPVTPERTYKLSGYISKAEINDPAYIRVTNAANETTSGGVYYINTSFSERYEYWYFFFNSTLYNADVTIHIVTENEGDIYFDNIYLQKVVNNTDDAYFQPDMDPDSTTNPNNQDSDGDGLYDGWYDENENWKFDSTEYGEDTDKDGDINSVAGWGSGGETDPNLKDTDEDGMDDAWEQNFDDRWPNTDGTEGSGSRTLDPLTADADKDVDHNDGLKGDGTTNIIEYLYGTNPCSYDSDEDTMNDTWERYYGLNPLDSSDGGSTDSDDDGLTNVDEYQYNWYNGEAGDRDDEKSTTNPFNPDSDGDGVLDGQESYIVGGVYSGHYFAHEMDGTSVSSKRFWYSDLDGDGMINALDYDSDNDDLSDGIETGVEELVVSVGSEDSEGRTRSSLVKIGPRSTAAIALTIKGLDATDNRNQVQDTDDDSLADSTEKDPEDWILKFIQENPGLAYEVLNELQFIIKEESIQESIRNYNPIIYNEMEPVFYQVKAEIHMTCIQGAKTQLSALVKTTANYDDNWVRISGKVFHPLGIQAVAVGLSENSLTRAKLYTKTPDPRYDSAPMIAVFCSENLDVLSDVGFNAFRLNNYDIYLEAQSSDGAALKTKTIEMKTLVDSEDSIYRIGLDQKTFSNLASKIPPLQFMHDLGTTLSLFTCGASDTYDWSKFAKNIEDEGRADPYLQVGKSWGSHFFVGASLRRAGCSYDLTMRFSFIYERGMKADTLKKTLGRIGTVLVTPEDVELQDKADHNAVMWGWVAAYVYGSSVSARDTAIRATLQRKLVHNENAYEGELEGEHYQIGSTKLPTWFWFVEEDPVYFEYGNTPRPEDEPDMDDIEDSWKWNRKEVKTPTDSLSDFKDYIGKGGPFHYDKIYRESNGSFVPLFVDGVPP